MVRNEYVPFEDSDGFLFVVGILVDIAIACTIIGCLLGFDGAGLPFFIIGIGGICLASAPAIMCGPLAPIFAIYLALQPIIIWIRFLNSPTNDKGERPTLPFIVQGGWVMPENSHRDSSNNNPKECQGVPRDLVEFKKLLRTLW